VDVFVSIRKHHLDQFSGSSSVHCEMIIQPTNIMSRERLPQNSKRPIDIQDISDLRLIDSTSRIETVTLHPGHLSKAAQKLPQPH
jgi:hypothetical protein